MMIVMDECCLKLLLSKREILLLVMVIYMLGLSAISIYRQIVSVFAGVLKFNPNNEICMHYEILIGKSYLLQAL
jgi:hypothetical protein